MELARWARRRRAPATSWDRVDERKKAREVILDEEFIRICVFEAVVACGRVGELVEGGDQVTISCGLGRRS